MPTVDLHDVRDAESFVKACMKRSGVKPHNRELYDDLFAAGMLELVILARKYDPERDDGPNASFAGFAWYQLPLKIISAWHAMIPEHILITHRCDEKCGGCDKDGKRVWLYVQQPASWDQHVARQGADDSEFGYDERRMRFAGEYVTPPSSTE